MYIGSLKFLIKFNNEYLFEEVTSTYLFVNSDEISPSQPTGGGISVISPNGMGYIMSDGQYLLGSGIANNGYDFLSSDQITIGFWLYPINHGLATSPSGSVESITMPLLTWMDSTTYAPIINFREHTAENNENYLTVDFNGSEYTITSEKYDANIWHYIWLGCNRTDNNFDIFIDGKLANASKTGGIPSRVSSGKMDLYINFSTDGYAYNIAKNYGIIDDIFTLNESITDAKSIQTVINNGIDYLVVDTLKTEIIDRYNIYFNDPNTITINSIANDMSYIYLGRNDGKILRGSPLFWQTRKIYSDKNEEDILGLTAEELLDNKIKNGLLVLKNTTIRL